MESDEDFARRLQAEFDEEERNANLREKKDAALAQKLASQSHDLSESEDEVIEDDCGDDVESRSRNIENQVDKSEDISVLSSVQTTSRDKEKKYKDHVFSASDDDEIDEIATKKKEGTPVRPSKTEVGPPSFSEDIDNDGSGGDRKQDTSQPSSSKTDAENNLKDQNPSKKRPLCKFGASCYRKNPWHLEEFYHPHLENQGNAKSDPEGSSDCQTPAKRQKTTSDEVPKQDSNISKRSFSTRLKASAPYNLFLNKTYSVKSTHEDPLALVFPDILNPKLGEIVESAQLNFMVDLTFLMDNYRACKVDKKPLLVMYGQMEGNPNDYDKVTCTKVNLPFQYGTHHTKMMLLQYTNGLRVVIHTANLVPDDWEEKTQGYWVSPLFPELGDDKSSLLDGESPTRFKRDLVEYILSYKAPDLTRWSHILKKYDFSSCNMVFIGSTPGYHVGEQKDRWGHMKVRRMMRQHATSWKSSLPIIAQCSSIGSLGKDVKSWLSGELGMSLTGAPGVCANPPSMKVVYPSESDVQNSSQGWMGGSCLPYNSATHAKQEWMQQHFHVWRSEKRRRTRSMPHIKTYTRLNKDYTKAQFLLLTSANLSKAAWGMLQKQNSQLFIRSYEVGVLALPKFVTGAEEFELKSPWKELGFSLPYDVPLTPYPSNAKPWCMDTKKSAPDVFGNTFP
ncbi:probable tyrosyl-DNA phosphodiesterase [Palaemon carinicauda]|uniref:probable tyrosyl-DNA phosphodiesterase n=1 Tax=Palaemon carinicauda TaxID=392227 RepID=UPI0035B5FD95